MDTLSHAAWGATIIRKKPELWWAAFSGALPDLITALYGLLVHKKGYFKFLKEFAFSKKADDYYIKVYYFSHSFIPITLVTLIIYFVRPAWAVIAIPYYLHILVDIFSHRGIWATRIFYPFSNFHFEGRNWWQNNWISIGNWAVLILVNIIIFAL